MGEVTHPDEVRAKRELSAVTQGDAAVRAWCEELHEATMSACDSVSNDDVLELLNQSILTLVATRQAWLKQRKLAA